MKKFLVIGLFSCLFLGLTMFYSCTKDKAQVAVSSACDSTQVTYNNTISRIVATYCTQLGGCHNPASGLGSSAGVNAVDLTTYFGVKAEDQDTTGANAIVCWLKAGCGTDQMPKGLRPLPQAYIDTFQLWRSNNFCQ